eukprot:jgi/Mesen1/2729/ME000168S01791
MAKLACQPSSLKVTATPASMEMQQSPVMLQITGSSARTSSLKEWDSDGDGIITEADLVAAAISHTMLKKRLKSYRYIIGMSILIVLLLLGGMVAAVVVGLEMTKDMSVKEGRLVSLQSGSPVGVNQIVNYKTLVDLFSITWLQLHSIQHITVYLPFVDKVVSFKVDAVERNKTDLVLFSTRKGEALDVTATGAVYIYNELQVLVEGNISATSGRRSLLQSSPPPPASSSTNLTGQAGTAGGSTTDASHVAPPCCP